MLTWFLHLDMLIWKWFPIAVLAGCYKIAGIPIPIFFQFFVTFFVLADIMGMKDTVMTFEKLYERYANDVYRFAYWLTGGREADAKDIASETFVQVWTSKTEPRT